MWLDRLAGGPATSSGATTPQPGSKPNPLSRRTSSNLSPYITSQRQGHSPRASSLSLVSNDSTSSLLSTSRRPNGSAQPRLPSAPEQVVDSIEILERLLNAGASEEKPQVKRPAFITKADLEMDVDFRGLSLQELASSDLPLPDATPSSARRPQTVEECACANQQTVLPTRTQLS